MEFEEFVRKMTKSAKDSNAHILAFTSDGERIFLTFRGNHRAITEAVATAITDMPEVRHIIKEAIGLIESRKMKVTRIDNEDQMNDYLIDLHLKKNKDLNNEKEGL